MASARATFGADLTSGLEGMAVPTLIVTADRDNKTPGELSQFLNERIRGSRLLSIAQAGHLSSVEQPAQFASALSSFFESREAIPRSSVTI